MLLTSAKIFMFKSIDNSGDVKIDPSITVLVGQNESGKTAFLQALHKAKSVEDDVAYDVLNDYPRKALTAYEKQHAKTPAVVAELTYQLGDDEVKAINKSLHHDILKQLSFKVSYKYGGSQMITLTVPEADYVQRILKGAKLSSEVATRVAGAKNLREMFSLLEQADLNSEEQNFLDTFKKSFPESKSTGWGLLDFYVWTNYLSPKVPKFLYFDEYYLLPGKVSLTSLQQRVQQNVQNKNALLNEDKTVLGLLRLAGVELKDLADPAGYENIKARLEGFSNSVSDRVFSYWTQNENLSVVFDIKADPQEKVAPFNSGNNLYIRVYDRRHRVSVPFDQRSKGFIWFFSFIVWFDSIKEQMGIDDDIILLLDEPGLSLHALAQADFLKYIDQLAKDHQVIYTTHSPFMVRDDRLYQVRTVEDKEREGTKITENVTGSDPKTIFPLQAALGYTIAQNLFISTRNLLVEGPADLVYLRFFSSMLEKAGRTYLREGITVVPVGGLDKLATFVALLGANNLELSVLHDYESRPDPRLQSLVRDRLIRDKNVLNYAMFRGTPGPIAASASTTGGAASLPSTDVEDLISPDLYLKLFNGAYKKQLGGVEIKETDLPPGERIVNRIGDYLKSNSITLRPSGGFNHYLVANHLASNPLPPSKVDAATLKRFESLFETVNRLYSA